MTKLDIAPAGVDPIAALYEAAQERQAEREQILRADPTRDPREVDWYLDTTEWYLEDIYEHTGWDKAQQSRMTVGHNPASRQRPDRRRAAPATYRFPHPKALPPGVRARRLRGGIPIEVSRYAGEIRQLWVEAGYGYVDLATGRLIKDDMPVAKRVGGPQLPVGPLRAARAS